MQVGTVRVGEAAKSAPPFSELGLESEGRDVGEGRDSSEEIDPFDEAFQATVEDHESSDDDAFDEMRDDDLIESPRPSQPMFQGRPLGVSSRPPRHDETTEIELPDDVRAFGAIDHPDDDEPELTVESSDLDLLDDYGTDVTIPGVSLGELEARRGRQSVRPDDELVLEEVDDELDLDEVQEAGRKPKVPSQPPPPPAKAKDAPPDVQPPEPPREPAPERTKKRRKPWFEDFFSDDYLRTVRAPMPKEVAREVDFIVRCMGMDPGGTILDVGCGLGLHAVELTSRGYLVVGLDLSLPMLSRASAEAQDQGLKINFLHMDMREMTFDGAFDVVLCWGTTLGYFDDETNRKVVERLYRALKPKGILLLDVVNRDHVIRSQPNLVWFEGDGCVCMEETQFNHFNSRLQVKRTVILDDGRQRENHYSIRLYALHELGQILHQQGFRVAEVSGMTATPGVFFGADSPRMVIVAQRRLRSETQPGGERPGTDPEAEGQSKPAPAGADADDGKGGEKAASADSMEEPLDEDAFLEDKQAPSPPAAPEIDPGDPEED